MVKGNPPNGTRSDCKDDYFNYAMRNARLENHIGCIDLARITGISMYSLQQIERVRHDANSKKRRLIAEALGLDVSEVFPTSYRDTVRGVRYIRKKRENRLLEEGFVPLETVSGLEEIPDKRSKEYDNELRKELEKALGELKERERQIIMLRFGLTEGNEKYSAKEISGMYGLSKVRIEQIESKALKRLRIPERRRALAAFL